MFPKDSWEVGDLVVVSGVSGTVRAFSADAKQVHVEHVSNEGEKYLRWHDVGALPPYEALTPHPPLPNSEGEKKPSAIVKRNSFKQGQRVRIMRDLAHHVKPLEVGDEGKVLDGRFFSDKYETWHFDDYMVDGVKRDALDFAEVIELESAAIVDSAPSPSDEESKHEEKKQKMLENLRNSEGVYHPAIVEDAPNPKDVIEGAYFKDTVRWGVCPICGEKKELHGGLCASCNAKAAAGEIATVKEPRLVRGTVIHHKAMNYNRIVEKVEKYTLHLAYGGGKVQWDADVWEVVIPNEDVIASMLTKADAQFGRIADLEEKLKDRDKRLASQAKSIEYVASKNENDKDAEIERLSKLLAEAETKVEALERANRKQSDLLKSAALTPHPPLPNGEGEKSLEERAAALFSAPVAKDDTQEVSTVEIRLATLEEQVAQMAKIVQLSGMTLGEVG